MDKKYINTMYSKDTQEYFDIYEWANWEVFQKSSLQGYGWGTW